MRPGHALAMPGIHHFKRNLKTANAAHLIMAHEPCTWYLQAPGRQFAWETTSVHDMSQRLECPEYNLRPVKPTNSLEIECQLCINQL